MKNYFHTLRQKKERKGETSEHLPRSSDSVRKGRLGYRKRGNIPRGGKKEKRVVSLDLRGNAPGGKKRGNLSSGSVQGRITRNSQGGKGSDSKKHESLPRKRR